MTELNEKQLITGLAREIIAEIAPQELPMFRAQSAAYFEDPEQAIKNQAGKDDVLGFGSGAAAAFVTPAVLALAPVIINFVKEAARESIQGEAKDLINKAVQSIFKKIKPAEKEKENKDDARQSAKDDAPLTLSPDQLLKLRELVVAQALVLRLSEKTAVTLADAFIGRLVMSAP